MKVAGVAAAPGAFRGGTYVGTLANGGAVLAPFHTWATKVPATLQAEVKSVEAQIIAGKIVPATKSPV